MEWKKIELFCVENLIWVLIVIGFITFSVLSSSFFTLDAIVSVLRYASVMGFLALALGIVILAGDFDVSLAQVAGLSALACSWLTVNTSIHWLLIILTPIGIGLAVGTTYGLLVGKVGVNSFLITLGGYIVCDALGDWIVAGDYFMVTDSRILFLGDGRIIGGLFVSTVVFVGLVLLVWVFVNYFRRGVVIYAVGRSVENARRVGIKTDNTKLLVFALAGLLAGLSGLMFVGYAPGGNVRSTIADGQIFFAFATVAFSGLDISGGRGNLIHILGGAIFLSIIYIGNVMIGMPYAFTNYFVPGALILVAVYLNEKSDVLRDRLLSGG